jgi:hypothetical protein
LLIVPPVSVEAVQLRLICAGETTVAVRFVGAVGGAEFPAGGAGGILEHPPNNNADETAERPK